MSLVMKFLHGVVSNRTLLTLYRVKHICAVEYNSVAQTSERLTDKLTNKLENERPRSGLFSQSEHCEYCQGFTYVTCHTCAGYGKMFMDGMREYLCDDCGGGGKIICRMCGGSGRNFML